MSDVTIDDLCQPERIRTEQEHANRARETNARHGIDLGSCVLCDDAPVTVAYVPSGRVKVCAKHFAEYAEEGRRYLPEHQRVFWLRLDEANCRERRR